MLYRGSKDVFIGRFYPTGTFVRRRTLFHSASLRGAFEVEQAEARDS